MGGRPFDRRLRHQRRQALTGIARQDRRLGRHRPGLSQPEPGLLGRRARHQSSARHHRLLLHLRQRSGDLRPPAAPARRHDPLGRLAVDHGGRRGETRRSGALRHIWRRRLCRGFQPEAKEFARLYKAASGGINADNYGSWTYDAIGVLAKAINDAKSTDPQKIREAIIAIKGYKGRGRIQFRRQRRRPPRLQTS